MTFERLVALRDLREDDEELMMFVFYVEMGRKVGNMTQ